MDLSDLLGTNSSGLLNAPQQGDVNSQTLMGLAAGLLKASGPSPYKHTTLSGIGEGIQGGLAARKSAFDDLLKQKLVAAQTNKLSQEQVLQAAQMAAEYKAAGLPVHPAIQHILDAASGGAGRGGIGAGPPGGMPQGAFAQAPPQQGQPMQQQPQQPAPGPPAGQPAPGAGGFPPGSPAARVQGLGLSPFGLVSKGPMADVTGAALKGNIAATDPAIEENERRKGIMKEDIARDAKLYPALTSLGQQGYTSKQDADLSLALAKDPGFYSGLGQGVNELWKKLQVAAGGDPNAVFSQEAFRKITSANINTQITEMKASAAEMGGAAGRIFQNQTTLMEKASQGLDNSPAANHLLAVLQGRAADYNIAVGDMAIAYKKKNGILDTGFDEQLSKYTREHPLVTKAELANVRQLTGTGSSGAPAAPAPAPGPAASVPGGPPQPAAPTKTAVGPGGKRLGLVNGQWVPIQ